MEMISYYFIRHFLLRSISKTNQDLTSLSQKKRLSTRKSAGSNCWDPRFRPGKSYKMMPFYVFFLGPTWKLMGFSPPSCLGLRSWIGSRVQSGGGCYGGGSWATRYSSWQPEIWRANQLRDMIVYDMICKVLAPSQVVVWDFLYQQYKPIRSHGTITQLHFFHARPTCRSA